MSVCFTNRLDQPDWWTELSHWLGEYNVRKYQKFIELWGSPITKEDIEENKYAILRVFKEVKLYFEENPVYGVTFPRCGVARLTPPRTIRPMFNPI